jgi:hypothetical protein
MVICRRYRAPLYAVLLLAPILTCQSIPNQPLRHPPSPKVEEQHHSVDTATRGYRIKREQTEEMAGIDGIMDFHQKMHGRVIDAPGRTKAPERDVESSFVAKMPVSWEWVD